VSGQSAQPEPQLRAILTHYGGFWEQSVAPFFASLYATGGLDKKTQELIVTALLALRGWETGVRTHAALALEAGATPREIRGAILITMGVGGVTSAASGMAWVEPILQEHGGQGS
jgi:AhpD family alkylhydroperoxidase